MAVAYEEIRVQGVEVEVQVAYAVRAVDAGEDAEAAAGEGECFKGHAHAGEGDDGVEYGDGDFIPCGAFAGDGVFEGCDEEGVRDWVGVFDFQTFGGRGFADAEDGFLAGAVDCGEDENFGARRVDEVAQDRVDGGGGVWDQGEVSWRCIEEGGEGITGVVEGCFCGVA